MTLCFHKHAFLADQWNCKKSPTNNEETPPNGNKFCMTVFNVRFKYPKVYLPITNISSIIKDWYFSTYEEFRHLASYTHRTFIIT